MNRPPSLEEIRAAVEALRAETAELLCDLIRFPSLPGQESEAVDYAARRFAEVAEVERIPLSNALREDPDYSSPLPGLDYQGRSNLRVCLRGTGKPGTGSGVPPWTPQPVPGFPPLLFNTHLDVVPAAPPAFEPRIQDGVVRGRGACDAKGQAATLWMALAALQRLGIQPPGDVIAHLVVEEEVGGNGTLAMIRRGEAAGACIVMEPTEMRILSSVRGAVWFRVSLEGRAGHSGRAGDTVSALAMARRVMAAFEAYHARLRAASRGIPLFDRFPNPMPLTFGKLAAGDWPAAAPARAVLEGVLGFLPNRTRFEVMEGLRRAILEGGDPWLREHFTLEFTYRHDAHVLAPDHPLVRGLQARCREAGLAGEVCAMTASCDSWFYNNQLGIPTAVFGPGSLRHAHSTEEQISLDDLAAAAAVLARFVMQ
ncbi:MAG: M20/M25/M40 family metallo-hydrolase [Acidobacteria bacterium]|nr:M20/M25/M40 family metallo-hydrolase [Acidobacteriota bacterium]